jgi:osmotically-inducible protein OsmY
MKKDMLLAALAGLALGLGSACHNTAQGVKEDARENSEKAQAESKKAAEESKDVAQKVTDGAQEVGTKVKEGAQEVVSEIDATKQLVDVKAALMADTTIDASHINVDTDADSKTVTLRGSVATSQQKATAHRIAESKAAGYTVVNHITVLSKSSGPPSD